MKQLSAAARMGKDCQKLSSKIPAGRCRLEVLRSALQQSLSEYGRDYPQHRVIYRSAEREPPSLRHSRFPAADAAASSSSAEIPPAAVYAVRPNGGALQVSEDTYDTVAVAITAKTLYVAFNYKSRAMPPSGDGKIAAAAPVYVGFGPSKPLMELATARIISEMGHPPPGAGMHPADITSIEFVGLQRPPSGEAQNAHPHAEMQLISHLSSEAAWGKLAPFGLLYGLRLGVTKAYCLRCAHELLSRRVDFSDFADRPGYEPEEAAWLKPDMIQTAALRRIPCTLWKG